MKKLFAFFLALVMCFSLAACGGEETTPADTNTPATNSPAVSNPGGGSSYIRLRRAKLAYAS